MAQIIMLGTVGCGKTILLTVLAQKYRSVSKDGYFLEAKSAETNTFTNQNWFILTEQHEWPALTPPDTLRHFRWQLHVSSTEGTPKLDVVAGDFSGETFQAGFGRGDWSSAEAKALKQYIDQSDGLLLLINLRDFMDQQDINRKSETEWALKYCLDYAVGQRFRQIAVVFTQIDRYQAVFAKCNNDARAVLNKYLPQIAGTYPSVQIFQVAAVNGITRAKNSDGPPIERPAKNFDSIGIDELLTWVSKTEPRNKPPPSPPVRPNRLTRFTWAALLLALLIGIAAVFALIVWNGESDRGRRPQQTQPPVTPLPVITAQDAQLVGTWPFMSYGKEVWGWVVNTGAAGNVTVHVKFKQELNPGVKSSEYEKSQYLGHDGSFDFHFTDKKTFRQRDGFISSSVWAD